MTRLTRTSQPQQKFQRKATRFIRNVGVVTQVLSNGYLPIRHNSLPVPFKSFEVETDAGKRYVIQVRGRQAFELDIKLGVTVEYEGRFIFATAGHGGYFLASDCEVTNADFDSYVSTLVDAKAELVRLAAEQS